MKRWLYMRWFAFRHVCDMGSTWHCLRYHGIWNGMRLRWLGGMYCADLYLEANKQEKRDGN